MINSPILFRPLLALTFLTALAPAAWAQPQPATLQAAASEVVFTTRQLGVPVEGRFLKFTAQVALDPRKPETGSVTLNIDTGSARFGSAELDAEVPTATWLNTARFPSATFQSSSVKGLGAAKFAVQGKLAIKGATQDMTVPVQLTQSGNQSTATGSFVVKRLAFKVGEGEWTDTSMLADDVQVRFKLVFSGMAPL